MRTRPLIPLSKLDDVRLCARAGAGDGAAFSALYDRHHRALLAFCRHMLGNLADGEDALQQTFIRAHQAMLRGQRPDEPRAWLFAIARNRCRTMLASRRDLATDGADQLEGVSVDGLSAEAQQRDELRELLADMSKLPEDQRAALLLTELRGFEHEQIATVIGCPAQKVKALVFQARSHLLAEREARDTECVEIRQRLETARGGELRRGLLRRHLRRCEPCQAYSLAVAGQRSELAGLMVVLPSAGLKASVLGAVGLADGVVGGGAAAAGAASAGGVGTGAGGAGAGAGAAAGGAGASVSGMSAGTAGVFATKVAVVKVAAVLAAGGVAAGGAVAAVDRGGPPADRVTVQRTSAPATPVRAAAGGAPAPGAASVAAVASSPTAGQRPGAARRRARAAARVRARAAARACRRFRAPARARACRAAFVRSALRLVRARQAAARRAILAGAGTLAPVAPATGERRVAGRRSPAGSAPDGRRRADRRPGGRRPAGAGPGAALGGSGGGTTGSNGRTSGSGGGTAGTGGRTTGSGGGTAGSGGGGAAGSGGGTAPGVGTAPSTGSAPAVGVSPAGRPGGGARPGRALRKRRPATPTP